MNYIFIADENAPPAESGATPAADGKALQFIAPRAWIATGNAQLCESSFDLHCGLDMIEGEIDTVPAELLNDLFKL